MAAKHLHPFRRKQAVACRPLQITQEQSKDEIYRAYNGNSQQVLCSPFQVTRLRPGTVDVLSNRFKGGRTKAIRAQIRKLPLHLFARKELSWFQSKNFILRHPQQWIAG